MSVSRLSKILICYLIQLHLLKRRTYCRCFQSSFSENTQASPTDVFSEIFAEQPFKEQLWTTDSLLSLLLSLVN